MFGEPAAAERLREHCAAEGAICQALPFGRAYHTPLFKPLADAFRDYFRTLDFGPGRTTLYSARSIGPFPQEPDAIRELAAQQWENPVRFTATIERLYADGYRVFLEVGPGGSLSSFIADTLRDRADVISIASDNRRRGSLAQLHGALAQLFAAGVSFDPRRLYACIATLPPSICWPRRVQRRKVTGSPRCRCRRSRCQSSEEAGAAKCGSRAGCGEKQRRRHGTCSRRSTPGRPAKPLPH